MHGVRGVETKSRERVACAVDFPLHSSQIGLQTKNEFSHARVCRYVVPRPRTPGVAPVEMEGGLGWDEVGTAWQRVELEAPRVASVTPRAASRSSLADSPDTDPASTASDDSRKRLAGQGGAGDDGPAVPKRARL